MTDRNEQQGTETRSNTDRFNWRVELLDLTDPKHLPGWTWLDENKKRSTRNTPTNQELRTIEDVINMQGHILDQQRQLYSTHVRLLEDLDETLSTFNRTIQELTAEQRDPEHEAKQEKEQRKEVQKDMRAGMPKRSAKESFGKIGY